VTDPANPNYGTGANPDLLLRIPVDARLVMDVGCGAGALGAAFKRRNPAARVIGVEYDEALAARAAAVLDTVHRQDIEATALPAEQASLDCLIYGDVLEHLRDPWAVLRRDAALLGEDGVLLACVPNVEHWQFAERLLRGGWRYEEMGLFDRTHLRWFSQETMREALEQAGLHVADVTPRIFDVPALEQFVQRIAPALGALGVDAQAYARRAAPLQYVWRATRRARAPMLVVVRTLRPQAGLNDIRIAQPLIAAASRPGLQVVIAQEPKLPAVPAETPRIMVLQRLTLTREAIPSLRRLRAQGYLLVSEFDDDPDRWPKNREGGYLTFAGLHAVQTSTEPLADILRQYNPEVRVFPNALDVLPEPVNFRDPQRLTLFFGALNREEDVAPFLPALNEVLAESGGRLAVEVVHDSATYEALVTPNKGFTPTCGLAEYRAVLARCELAFLPLADTRFNRLKSDLKFVEAAGYRLAALASPTVYAASIRDGETGLVLHDAAALKAALRRLLAAPAEALRLAEAGRAHVAAERMLGPVAMARRAWYRELWARRAELDAKLRERVPELAG